MSKAKGLTVERDVEHLSLVERNRIRANVQASLGEVRSALKRCAAGIDVPLNVPMEADIGAFLQLERRVQELKNAVGVTVS